MPGNITVETALDSNGSPIVVVTTASNKRGFRASQVDLTADEAQQLGSQLKICAGLIVAGEARSLVLDRHELAILARALERTIDTMRLSEFLSQGDRHLVKCEELWGKLGDMKANL